MDAQRTIAVAALLLAGFSPASALEVGHVPAIHGGIVETRFAANPALGRAWIEVTVRDPRLRDESSIHEVVHHSRMQVPGLAYDAATSRIVFAQDGQQVACADVASRSGLLARQPVVRATGRCLIAQESMKVAEDDGFEVRQREQIQLRLRIPGVTAG